MTEAVDRADYIAGSAKVPVAFEHLDMALHLRMRAFIPICMPAMFADVERRFPLSRMRRQGITNILFYVELESTDAAIAFGRSLHTDYELRLFRSCTDERNRPAARGSGTERLLFESHSRVRGRRQSDAGAFSSGEDDAPLVEAGRARVLHILTRPTAPPGERRVERVPEALAGLREHDWDGPLPSPAMLDRPDEGWELAGSAEYRDVWGMPNTDVNQHVNVLEYVMTFENQVTRQLRDAGLTIVGHRLARSRLLFRKPCFPGEPFVVRSELYRREQRTLLVGGLYGVDADGAPAGRPSAAAVMEGVLPGG